MRRLWHRMTGVGALGWLLLVEPFDLAVTLAREVTRPDLAGWLPWLLLGSRVAVVALGLATGLSLARRAPPALALARMWAAGEAATLTVVWSSAVWPTNRPPGLLLPVALVYTAAVACVLLAARDVDRRLHAGAAVDLPAPPRSR